MSDLTPQAAALLQRARELPDPEQLAAVRGALARKLEAGAAPSCGEPESLGRPGFARRGLWGLGGKVGLAAGLTVLAGAGVLALRAAPHVAVRGAAPPPSAAHEPGPDTAADAPAGSVMEVGAPSAGQAPRAAAPETVANAAHPARTRSSGRPVAPSAPELPRRALHTRDPLARAANARSARPAAASLARQPVMPAAEDARVAPEQPQGSARVADEGSLSDVRDQLSGEENRPSAAPVSERDRLAREVAMLAGARAALERGNETRALQILDAHASEFPAGALSEEQLALRARALCALGRIDEGRRAVQRLAARGPDSPHLKRSEAACWIVE